MNRGLTGLKNRSGRFSEGKSRDPSGNRTTINLYSSPLPGLYIDAVKPGIPGNVTV
jgi:hypothetical protein